MRLQRYDDPSRFLDDARPFLEASEAANCLIIGIVGARASAPDASGRSCYLAIIREGEDVVGAVVMTPPRHLIVSAMPEEGVGLLVDDLHGSEMAPPGILAPPDVSAAFVARWSERTGERWILSMRQRTHQLDRVEALPAVPGSFRQAAEEDLPLLVDWARGFDEDIPTLGGAPTDLHAMMSAGIRRGGYYLWCDPEPVTMAAWTGRTWSGSRIYHVYTPHELRRRGYATACVQALTGHLLATGNQRCFLNTDLANPTSNGIYARIGYRPVCDTDLYLRVDVER